MIALSQFSLLLSGNCGVRRRGGAPTLGGNMQGRFQPPPYSMNLRPAFYGENYCFYGTLFVDLLLTLSIIRDPHNDNIQCVLSCM